MQALFELVAGLLSALAALAFAQFGVSLHGKSEAKTRPPEVRRTIHPDQSAGASTDQPPPVTRPADKA